MEDRCKHIPKFGVSPRLTSNANLYYKLEMCRWSEVRLYYTGNKWRSGSYSTPNIYIQTCVCYLETVWYEVCTELDESLRRRIKRVFRWIWDDSWKYIFYVKHIFFNNMYYTTLFLVADLVFKSEVEV